MSGSRTHPSETGRLGVVTSFNRSELRASLCRRDPQTPRPLKAGGQPPLVEGALPIPGGRDASVSSSPEVGHGQPRGCMNNARYFFLLIHDPSPNSA